MTTTATALGANSVAINYSVNSTKAEVLQAISDFLTTHGWAVHDAAAGTNAVAFKADNADGVSRKFMVVDTNTDNFLLTKVYEDWNATTHVGTNLAYQSDATAKAQQLSLSNSGYVYVFATARYALFLTKKNDGALGDSVHNSFSGICEISKDNPDEVAGQFPIYAFVNGGHMMGHNNVNPNYPMCFALPRTKAGKVAADACSPMSVSCLAGITVVSNSDSSYKLSTMLPSQPNPWSVDSHNFVFTPFAVETNRNVSGGTPFNIRGRFYGLKILSNQLGSVFDLATIKVDGESFYSPVGTDQDHHVLSTNQNNRFAIPV